MTLALSLAASAACSGRKAVVVGLDLRRPRLRSEADLTKCRHRRVPDRQRPLEEVLYARRSRQPRHPSGQLVTAQSRRPDTFAKNGLSDRRVADVL